MTEGITRREAIGGPILAAIPVVQYIVDRWRHKDMVPLDTLIETNGAYQGIMDKMRVEHSRDLQAQFERHMQALSECLSERRRRGGSDDR
jgi:hypothetical protein